MARPAPTGRAGKHQTQPPGRVKYSCHILQAALDGLPETVTKKQAEQALKCSTQTIDRLVKAGKLRAYRVTAKKTLINAADLKARFTEGEVQA